MLSKKTIEKLWDEPMAGKNPYRVGSTEHVLAFSRRLEARVLEQLTVSYGYKVELSCARGTVRVVQTLAIRNAARKARRAAGETT